MNNNGVFANLHFCDFRPDGVEVKRRAGLEYVTFTMGQGSAMTLSGEFGLARQLVERLAQELEKMEVSA